MYDRFVINICRFQPCDIWTWSEKGHFPRVFSGFPLCAHRADQVLKSPKLTLSVGAKLTKSTNSRLLNRLSNHFKTWQVKQSSPSLHKYNPTHDLNSRQIVHMPFTIKTEVKDSESHGKGIFALEYVPKGGVVWTFGGKPLSVAGYEGEAYENRVWDQKSLASLDKESIEHILFGGYVHHPSVS
jgi:hypothetical protein